MKKNRNTRIQISDLHSRLKKAAARLVPADEAEAFANAFMDTHLRKYPRMNPVKEAVDDLLNWQANPGRRFRFIVDKPGIFLLDMDGLAPSLKIKFIHDTLEKKARANGIAAAGLKNTAGIITLNMWADELAKRDLIGIAMFNGGCGYAVPFGAKKGLLGTNPVAYAVPCDKNPVVMDMATSEIPYFEIKNARSQNLPLKPDAAVDQEGLPTTDAHKAMTADDLSNLLPIGGGMKGYGIMMLVEILTGGLVQSLFSTEQTPGFHPAESGCFLLALDPAGFGDITDFKKRLGQMGDIVRSMDPAPGRTSVPMPGDRGHGKKAKALAMGEIEVEEETLKKLESFL